MFTVVINKCESRKTAFMYCVQCRFFMFSVVINKWDCGETAFIHVFSVGIHV
jgi:hypothetical protein